jgi:hypothetical protein
MFLKNRLTDGDSVEGTSKNSNVMVHFGELSVNFQLTMSDFLMNFAIFPLILSLSKDEKRIIRGALA